MIQVSDISTRVEHWFNTVNLEDKELQEAVRKAKNQENAVYSFFVKRPGYCFTPFQVLGFLKKLNPDVIKQNTPVTSIRRTMTNLTDGGFLVKTGEKIVEEYGKPNHLWKLYEPEKQQTQGKFEF